MAFAVLALVRERDVKTEETFLLDSSFDSTVTSGAERVGILIAGRMGPSLSTLNWRAHATPWRAIASVDFLPFERAFVPTSLIGWLGGAWILRIPADALLR